MKKAAYTLLVLFLVLACKEQSSQTKEENDVFTETASYLGAIEEQGFSGSVLVDYKGEVFQSAYGMSDRNNEVANTVNTVFDIGSIAKQFTAAGILKLEMMGKLSVDDLISDYFNDVPEDKQGITLHHMLTHSAGFPGGIGDDYEAITESDFVDRAFEIKLLTPPGEQYHYSNVGYSLLAIIIEKVSGVSYEAFLSEHLFAPSGMRETGYTKPDWSTNNIAIGYDGDSAWGRPNEKPWSPDGPYLHLKGNGGILSTVGDMHRWHNALKGNEVLNGAAKEKYYGTHIAENEEGSSHYGYGWAIYPTPRDTQLITHNGGNGIFFADFLRYLSEDLTIIMLSNKANRYTEGVAWRLAGLMLVDDYAPSMPNDAENMAADAEIPDDHVIYVVETIRDGNPEVWQPFIEEHGSLDFQGMVPMEEHFTLFGEFQKQLAGGEVEGIIIDEDEVFAMVKTPEKDLKLTIFIALDDADQIKIDGLKLE